MKLSVIGGGSTFISFFINGLDLIREELQVDELVLMDIDEKRLSIVGNFARRMAKKRNLNTKIELTLDPVNAIKNSDFVITTIRPGGLKARATDERIALKYGLFPHETLGVVGLSYALRVVPPIVNYTRLVEKYAPDAWLIHFTNPASITAQASVKYVPNVKVFSVCDVPLALAAGIAYM
ncbi:MAG: family 4 glycosyl hydrolase, partial [Candidatus Njordarchaeales archaeon]